MAPTKKKPSGAWFEKQRRIRQKENAKSSLMFSSWVNGKKEDKNELKDIEVQKEEKEIKTTYTEENDVIIALNDEIDNDIEIIENAIKNNSDSNEDSEDDILSKVLEIENNELNIDYNDPGSWPTFTPKFRDLQVERGPYLIDQNTYFPKNDDDGRRFDSKWFYKTLNNGEKVRRQWLIYSTSKNAIFCFPCLLFSKNNIRKNVFSDDGFQDWKHLNPCIVDHENCKNHKQNLLDWKELEKRLRNGKTIDHEHENAIRKEKEKWFCILKVVVDGVLFCAKNNLALRGGSEKIGDVNCGIFLNLMEVISHYNPILSEHVKHIKESKKPTISYFSHKIQNEMICIMGQKVRQIIFDQIKKAKYYSIMFDCTPDSSHQEQMTQIIRYCHISNGEVSIKESFIDFLCSDKKSGIGLFDQILKTISDNGLSIMDCRGQGYDNGANMAGINNGVQSHILRVNKLATFVPCTAHNLNLVGVHAAEISPLMITFFGIVQNIYTFFSRSTSRWELLMKTIKTTLKSHCETRWSTKKKAVNALKLNFKKVFDVLSSIANNKTEYNKDTTKGAQDILKQINLKFLCLLQFWDFILGQIDKVNLSLQYQNQTIDVATKMLEGLIECIQNIRNSGFENSINEAKKLAIIINIPSDFPAKRKIKFKGYEFQTNEEEMLNTTETQIKLQCFQSLDSIITNLKWRFEKLSDISTNFGFLSGPKLSIMENDDIRKWSDDLALFYKDDIDGSELYTEVQSFKFQASKLLISFKNATSYDFFKFIHQHSLQDVYPNMEIALRIFLTMPVTTATCERSFSKLKIIKNYLRSSMYQERLSNLSILSIEHEIASNIDYTSIIEDFANKKARRVNII